MTENAVLSGSIDQFDLEFVEREATPEFLMKLSIQLHLTGISLSNTVSVLETFGVDRVRSTVHNWVQKADLQPDGGRSPDHIAIDETVIRVNGQWFWLYAAVDPATNDLLNVQLVPMRNDGSAADFLTPLRQKHDLDDPLVLIDGHQSLKNACERHDLDFDIETHGLRNSVKRVFSEVKRRTLAFSNSFSHAGPDTVNDWLLTFAFAWNRLI